jgi:hypothetical protein
MKHSSGVPIRRGNKEKCWLLERRAFGGSDTCAHGAHGETHAFVGVDEVGEDFGGGCDGDAALVAEFVESALHS